MTHRIRSRLDQLEEEADLRLRAATDPRTLTDAELEAIMESGSPRVTAALRAATDATLEAIASGEVMDPEAVAQLLGIDPDDLEAGG
jgi:hypothetical protein